MSQWTYSEVKQLREDAKSSLHISQIAKRLGRKVADVRAAARRYEIPLRDGREGSWIRTMKTNDANR